MEINTTLFRKAPRFGTRLCKVEKILELSGSDVVHLKKILWKNTTFSDCQGSCQQKYIFFVLSDYQIVCCP